MNGHNIMILLAVINIEIMWKTEFLIVLIVIRSTWNMYLVFCSSQALPNQLLLISNLHHLIQHCPLLWSFQANNEKFASFLYLVPQSQKFTFFNPICCNNF